MARSAQDVRNDLLAHQSEVDAAEAELARRRAAYADTMAAAAAVPGWSYETVGRVLGLSKQRVGEYVKQSKARARDAA